MAKQRNEPNDLLSEVMKYDESKSVSGTSEDDLGSENVDLWPDHINPKELTSTHREVWRDWVKSNYNKLTYSNYKKLAEGKDYSKQTARRVINKVAKNQRTLQDIRDSEKLGVVIYAHEGLNTSPMELEDKYPLSRTTFEAVKYSFPDLVEELIDNRGKPGEGDVKKTIEEYDKWAKGADKNLPDSKSSEWPTGEKERAIEYWINNPDATAEEVKKEANLSVAENQISGLKGELVKRGDIDVKDENKTLDDAVNQTKDKNQDGKLVINIEFTDSEVKQILNGDEQTLDVRDRVVEKIVTKAFGG